MRIKKLLESINLNHHQRYILLQVKISETPTLAFEQTNKSEADVKSREILRRYGYLLLGDNMVKLTEKGEESLIRYGLVDETGEVTDMGNELLTQY